VRTWGSGLVLTLLIGCNGGGGGEGAGAKEAVKNGGPSGGPGPEPSSEAGSGGTPLEARYTLERERMVEQLASPFNDAPITDKRVLDALRRVPRHEFVPESVRSQSYQNRPLPIAESQTISQPYIVALMTQLLELDGSEKVLEIGTGSGYQAAILGELAAELTTVEIRPQLLEEAKKKLEEMKARGILRWKKLVAVAGDGSKGYPPDAPYDAIIVTAAPNKVPDALLEQLRPGGRLVIPVGDFFQELRLIRKDGDGKVTEKTIVPVRFVPLLEDQK
jgi:protein-L-isoaspartate(D-aspartate) O-methyltransferase